jgi:hypothetical protein
MLKWLIDDVHKAWRYMSVQLTALLALAATAWEYVPSVQQYLDPTWLKYFAVAIIVSRVVRQSPKQPVIGDADDLAEDVDRS